MVINFTNINKKNNLKNQFVLILLCYILSGTNVLAMVHKVKVEIKYT